VTLKSAVTLVTAQTQVGDHPMLKVEGKNTDALLHYIRDHAKGAEPVVLELLADCVEMWCNR
jgi:hypothetical protein